VLFRAKKKIRWGSLTTFKVRLELCDVGDRAGASDDVMRVARRIFTKLDTDKEHFVLLAFNNKNRIIGRRTDDCGRTPLRLQLSARRRYTHSLVLPEPPLMSREITL
jgi:hypothetical protein